MINVHADCNKVHLPWQDYNRNLQQKKWLFDTTDYNILEKYQENFILYLKN